jgi:nucleoside-diphosphate-sugar epimerase
VRDRVLVTGAGGYLGRHIAEELRGEGVEAVAVVRREPDRVSPVRMVVCELADAAAVEDIIAKTRPMAVIHAAAWIGSDTADPARIAEAMASNVTATANVVSACAKAGTSRLVYCSSVEVYAAGPRDGVLHREDDPFAPPGLYGWTKAAGELAVRALEGSATAPRILRLPGLHGAPRTNGIVYRLLKSAATGAPIDLPEASTRLSFLWVRDAARVAVACGLGRVASTDTVLNVANGSFTLSELADRIGAISGRPLAVKRGTAQVRNRALDTSRIEAALPFEMPAFEVGLVPEWSRIGGG